METIIPVAVIRRITDKGAELVNLCVLDQTLEDGRLLITDEELAFEPHDWKWEGLMELVANEVRCGYYTPDHMFVPSDADINNDDEVLTNVLVIEINNPDAARWYNEFCRLESVTAESGLDVFHRLAKVFTYLDTDHENMRYSRLDLFGELLMAFHKLAVPPIIPFGSCEFDAQQHAGKTTA